MHGLNALVLETARGRYKHAAQASVSVGLNEPADALACASSLYYKVRLAYFAALTTS
jgi:hypothetical protein